MSKESYNAYMGAGTFYQGKITYDHGKAQIYGRVEGEIETAEGSLEIGQSAFVHGTIRVAELDLAGTLEGTVIVTEKTNIRPTGVLRGTLTTKALKTEIGAKIHGTINMCNDVIDVDTPRLSITGEKALEPAQ